MEVSTESITRQAGGLSQMARDSEGADRITWDDMLKVVDLKCTGHTDANDILLGSCNLSCQSGNSSINQAVQEFITVVCGEVEDQAQQLNGSLNDSCETDLLAVLGDEKLRGVRNLIAASNIRTESGLTATATDRQHLRSIRELAAASWDNVTAEWETWEVQVSETLRQTICDTLNGIDDEVRAIERHICLAEDVQESISLKAGRAVRKARRRSITRCKVSRN